MVYMARQKLGEQLKRKIFKIGRDRTYAITLPIEAIRNFKWQEGQFLNVEIDEKTKELRVRDWEK